MHGLPEILLANENAVKTFKKMAKQAKIDSKRKPHVIKFIGTKAAKFVTGLRFKSGKSLMKAWGIPA